MKAVVTRGDGSVEVAEIPRPELRKPSDVILRVTASAICGSDLHFIRQPILDPSTALGHEFIGVVEEAGPAVRAFAVGNRVKSRMFVSCGRCVPCSTGNQPRCPDYQLFGGPNPRGGALSGGQAEFVRIPNADRTLTGIAGGMSDVEALLLTDTLPTAWDAVVGSGTPAGRTFAVVGAGPVGQQVIAVALALGASAVYAIDMDERRLAAAERIGAIPVSASDGHPGQKVRELAGGGVDVAVEAVGSQSAVETAMQVVGSGGELALVGAFLGGDLHFAVADLLFKSVVVRPILGNPYATEHLITPLLTQKKLVLNDLIDLDVPLSDAVSAYEAFAKRRVNKVILRP